jgi:hypothetical protein
MSENETSAGLHVPECQRKSFDGLAALDAFEGGMFAAVMVTALDRQDQRCVTFGVKAADLASPDVLRRMFDPAIQALVDGLTENPAEELDAA